MLGPDKSSAPTCFPLEDGGQLLETSVYSPGDYLAWPLDQRVVILSYEMLVVMRGAAKGLRKIVTVSPQTSVA